MILGEPLGITIELAKVFDFMSIDYLVGGSLASSLYGIPRATQDVDVVADIQANQVETLVSFLKNDFYVDADLIYKAIEHKRSFNIIHLQTMFKIDVFVLKGDEPSLEEMRRRRGVIVDENSTDSIFLASAEDVIIHKLKWYELGNRISERQWNDVLGVFRIQKNHLDYDYLNRSARVHGVLELLDKALASV